MSVSQKQKQNKHPGDQRRAVKKIVLQSLHTSVVQYYKILFSFQQGILLISMPWLFWGDFFLFGHSPVSLSHLLVSPVTQPCHSVTHPCQLVTHQSLTSITQSLIGVIQSLTSVTQSLTGISQSLTSHNLEPLICFTSECIQSGHKLELRWIDLVHLITLQSPYNSTQGNTRGKLRRFGHFI